MIVFTIGTSEPFDRLVSVADAVAEACDDEVLVQGGRSECRFTHARLVDFLPYEELLAVIAHARIVVTHAGVGSILLALGQKRSPIVVPRRKQFGEAVDDHQLIFGRRLHELGLVHLVEEPSDLPQVLASIPELPSGRGDVGGTLAQALRSHLAQRVGPAGGTSLRVS